MIMKICGVRSKKKALSRVSSETAGIQTEGYCHLPTEGHTTNPLRKKGNKHRKPEGEIREVGQVEFVPRNLRESVETFDGIRCHSNHLVVRNGEDTAT